MFTVQFRAGGEVTFEGVTCDTWSNHEVVHEPVRLWMEHDGEAYTGVSAAEFGRFLYNAEVETAWHPGHDGPALAITDHDGVLWLGSLRDLALLLRRGGWYGKRLLPEIRRSSWKPGCRLPSWADERRRRWIMVTDDVVVQHTPHASYRFLVRNNVSVSTVMRALGHSGATVVSLRPDPLTLDLFYGDDADLEREPGIWYLSFAYISPMISRCVYADSRHVVQRVLERNGRLADLLPCALPPAPEGRANGIGIGVSAVCFDLPSVMSDSSLIALLRRFVVDAAAGGSPSSRRLVSLLHRHVLHPPTTIVRCTRDGRLFAVRGDPTLGTGPCILVETKSERLAMAGAMSIWKVARGRRDVDLEGTMESRYLAAVVRSEWAGTFGAQARILFDGENLGELHDIVEIVERLREERGHRPPVAVHFFGERMFVRAFSGLSDGLRVVGMDCSRRIPGDLVGIERARRLFGRHTDIGGPDATEPTRGRPQIPGGS